ncbi:hypothetical protein OK016_17175 [Vibrio chagasii]|nr:hypothetical protein [Vibrio chagasii]
MGVPFEDLGSSGQQQ